MPSTRSSTNTDQKGGESGVGNKGKGRGGSQEGEKRVSS